MNEQQNIVLATFAVGLFLVVVYLCPWRIESTGELKWSPIYQTPMSYVRSYDGTHSQTGSSRFEYEPASIAWDVLMLEVIILIGIGGGLYLYFSDPSREETEGSDGDTEDLKSGEG